MDKVTRKEIGMDINQKITEELGVAEGSSWNRKAMKKAPRVDSLECRRKKFW